MLSPHVKLPIFNRLCYSVRMKRLLIVLFLSGCASVNPQAFTGPSGNPAYTMKCSGMGRDMADCYRKASELCPGGYDVIGQQSGTNVVPTALGPVGAPSNSIAVECR